MKKKIKLNLYGSDCCKAPVRVGGKTTHYYICDKCKRPCDRVKIGEIE